jgi:ubiquinone/menaquinone biosynthesis C-methylase UbiE
MSFAVSGSAYDRFMGRYSWELAAPFADFAGVEAGLTALDVGCGSGVLTEELANRLGAQSVAAADPSPLVTACAERVPGADVRTAAAEALPWPDGSFDLTVAQLVILFLDDPNAGVSEMRRVVRVGGTVAACVWDVAEGMTLLRTFWDAARVVDPQAPGEGTTLFASPDELAELWQAARLREVETATLEVEAGYEGFDDYWGSFLLGVGPAGEYCASLERDRQEALREECRGRLGDPAGPFSLPARAWAVRGRV